MTFVAASVWFASVGFAFRDFSTSVHKVADIVVEETL